MTTEKFATAGLARLIDVYLLPTLVERPQELAGKAVVVIDVLRATTTIIHALAAGAAEVTVCQEVDEALRLAASRPQRAVLGGERGGLPIAGFDLGNSPTAYSRERVAGREVIFTTTNGTRAMARCSAARRILIGAFVNFSAMEMEKLVSLCKRRGFLFQSSEIYGGLNGFWDYGPLGVELKRNIKDAWWRDMVTGHDDLAVPPGAPRTYEMTGLDCTIIMHPQVWKCSGHYDLFMTTWSTAANRRSATATTRSAAAGSKPRANGSSSRRWPKRSTNRRISRRALKFFNCGPRTPSSWHGTGRS
jgi:hypothetical protein